ncbi:homoserine O-succinyltransferase [Pseudomonadota bacterium]|nr:homoserine O-succinyltransferase [Pseudomonadota bacterium]
MRIGILNTDTLKSEFDTKYGQYPVMFSNVLLQAEPNLQIRTYEVQFGDYPAELDECDAYLITGSKVSAYDDIAWIHELKSFVRSIHQHQKKLIGICFGHQLIAEALGGKVERSNGGWHVGVHGATLKKNTTLFGSAQQEFNLIYNHQDQVLKIPQESILLASCKNCPVAMLAIEDHILSFQGHVEFDVAYAKDLLEMRRSILGEDTYLKASDSLKEKTENAKVTDWILKFLQKD